MTTLKNNEQGSTLIVTLLTIVVILIFSGVLINTTLNSAAQINKTEQDIQATHLAEMGVTYFHEALTEEINKIKKKDVPLTLQNVEEAVRDIALTRVIKEDYTSFIIEVENPMYNENKDKIVVPYKSKGILLKPERVERILSDSKTVSGAIVIPGKGDGGDSGENNDSPFSSRADFNKLFELEVPPVEIPDDSELFNKRQEVTGSDTYNNSVSYKSDLTLNSQASLTVRDNFYIKQVLELVSPSSLSIGGDAEFSGKTDIRSKSSINIGGSLLINSNNETVLESPSSLTVGGAADLNTKLDVRSGSSLSVSDFLLVKGATTLESPSQIKVGSAASFTSTLDVRSKSSLLVEENLYVKQETVLESPSKIVVGGSAWFGHKVDVRSDSQISINNHLFVDHVLDVGWNGLVTVKGNADFLDNVNVGSSGKVCIYGTANFSHKQTDAARIKYANSCDNQPNGTIYVLNKPVDTGDDNVTDKVIIGSEGVQY